MTLEGSDAGVFFGGSRVSRRLFDGDDEPVSMWLDLEAEYFHGRGEDQGTLEPGAILSVQSLYVTGPADVSSRATVNVLQVRAAGGWHFGEKLELGGMAGLGVFDIDVRVDAGGSRGRDDQTSAMPCMGLRLALRATESIQVYGQFVAAARTDTAVLIPEAGARLRLAGPVGLSAGWRRVDIEIEHDSVTSDVEFELEGVFANLELFF